MLLLMHIFDMLSIVSTRKVRLSQNIKMVSLTSVMLQGKRKRCVVAYFLVMVRLVGIFLLEFDD